MSVKGLGWLTLFIFSLFFIFGCSSSSSNSGHNDPLETQDVSGVWNGHIVVPGTPDVDVVADGIVTEQDFALFAGFSSLFISHSSNAADRFIVQPNSATFTGNLDYSTWDTAGDDYACTPFQEGQVISTVITKTSLGFTLGLVGGGTYRIDDNNAKIFYFLYNTAYDNPEDKETPTAPTVDDLKGDWEIANAWQTGNTLTLTISDSGTAGTVLVSGTDAPRGNNFTGTMTLHASTPQKHVYDVNLTLKGTIQMTGLAAFMNEYDADEKFKDRVLIIGAVNDARTYFLVGHATKNP